MVKNFQKIVFEIKQNSESSAFECSLCKVTGVDWTTNQPRDLSLKWTAAFLKEVGIVWSKKGKTFSLTYLHITQVKFKSLISVAPKQSHFL